LEPWSTRGKFPDLEKDVEVEVESYYECSNATIRSPNVGHIKVWVLGGKGNLLIWKYNPICWCWSSSYSLENWNPKN
jgi:hypothetical protein